MQKASSRPIWSGSINFGLVTIPVRLFTAVREQNVHFRSLHDQDMVPLKQKLYCPAHENKEVHREHIVKGYEIAKDQFVVIRQEEIEAAAPKSTKSIEIQDFVDLDEIDPLFFDRPYYVAPKPEGAKPYKLLLEAMEKKKKVGIAKVVMWSKEYLCALRPLDGILCLETMHFEDEVVERDSVVPTDAKAKIDDREMKIAQQLIDSLTSKFEPGKYHDEYREKILELVEKKAAGEEIVSRPPEEDEPVKATNLIAALEASLARAKPGSAGKSSSSHGRDKDRDSKEKNGHSREHPKRRSKTHS
ncbi:MAG TPA: Ku protein [Tepidisphaeraceae bacterium]|jgi:DNA end-binding protein Ku